MTAVAVDGRAYRHVLGHFCTGVTVVTALDGQGPVGFACQSFAALSLDPPLVLFCPSRSSRTWPAIERAGRFCVNVLAEGQREISTVFGRGGDDKFGSTAWTLSPGGAPVLDDVLAWLDCSVTAVHEAGDHYVVVGHVDRLGEARVDRPLLFYRGGYTATAPEPDATAPGLPDDVDAFLTWPRTGDWL
jgi:3-hydroxy-9,10-secoandrosta-1,3,5(10)-triene-9,17-dione monooxygenase reductase component